MVSRIHGKIITMKILIACEFSGVVRNAFRVKGHDAYSCDLIYPDDESEFHIHTDVLKILDLDWDLMIAFPPCTHLCVSGARWFKDKTREQDDALEFVKALMAAPIPRICIENPIGIISTRIREPDQIIQPWMFGHGETKATCLWLKNLPKLASAKIVPGREQRIWNTPPSKDRWKTRSRTFKGIAKAMAEQWTNPITLENYIK